MIRKIATLEKIYAENPGQLLPENWIRLLRHNKKYEGDCPFHRFMGRHWVNLILGTGNRLHWASRCPWELLTVNDWDKLLRRFPEYETKISDSEVRRRLIEKNHRYVEMFDLTCFDKGQWNSLYEIKNDPDEYVINVGELEMSEISGELWQALAELRGRIRLRSRAIRYGRWK